jgi:hypothetical protein
MSFSTSSYLAGVGSVVVAVAVGFSGGFFMAKPPEYVEPNRLQRVTSSASISNPAPPTTPVVAAPSAADPKPVTTEVNVAVQQPTAPPHPIEAIPVVAKASGAEQAPALAKAAEPVRADVTSNRDAQPAASAESLRAAEAKAAERKRSDARKLAERRKQREIEQAVIAVRRITRDDRDRQQVADGFETPRFGFFGRD